MNIEEALKMLEDCGTNIEQPFEDMVIKTIKKMYELLGLYQKARKQVEKYVDTPDKKPKVLHLALDIHDTLNDIDDLEKELEEIKVNEKG